MIVPKVFRKASLMAPSSMASMQALMAHAPAAEPIRYSRIIFQPITKAMNSPTVT